MKLVKKLRRSSDREDFSMATVTMCLETLGIIERSGKRQKQFDHEPDRYRRIPRFEGFWGQDRFDLEDMLRESREVFKARIAEVHPDKDPTQEPLARRLIAAHRRIETLFKRHNITLDT